MKLAIRFWSASGPGPCGACQGGQLPCSAVERGRSGVFDAGMAYDTITPKRVLHSNFGCCIGTIEKSATYKISGAAERRAVPIRELVENTARRLKGGVRHSQFQNEREQQP